MNSATAAAVCGLWRYTSVICLCIKPQSVTESAGAVFVQESGHLFKMHVTSIRNVVIMFGHWLLHAFSIIALTQLRNPVVHTSLLSLVPFPAIFYMLTVKFTDPSGLDLVTWTRFIHLIIQSISQLIAPPTRCGQTPEQCKICEKSCCGLWTKLFRQPAVTFLSAENWRLQAVFFTLLYRVLCS